MKFITTHPTFCNSVRAAQTKHVATRYQNNIYFIDKTNRTSILMRGFSCFIGFISTIFSLKNIYE